MSQLLFVDHDEFLNQLHLYGDFFKLVDVIKKKKKLTDRDKFILAAYKYLESLLEEDKHIKNVMADSLALFICNSIAYFVHFLSKYKTKLIEKNINQISIIIPDVLNKDIIKCFFKSINKGISKRRFGLASELNEFFHTIEYYHSNIENIDDWKLWLWTNTLPNLFSKIFDMVGSNKTPTEILENSNLEYDSDILKPSNATPAEKSHLKNITIDFIDGFDQSSINKLQEEPFIYFIEDTCDELNCLLTLAVNAEGFSTKTEKTYDYDLRYIYDKLWNTIYENNEEDTKLSEYRIDFLQAIDRNLTQKIDSLNHKSPKDKYLYIISKDHWLNNKIAEFVKAEHHLQFYEIDLSKLDLNKADLSQNMIVNNFNVLANKDQRIVWEKIALNGTTDNIVLIFSDALPQNIMVKSAIDIDRIWKYSEEKVLENISEIFHSILMRNFNIKIDDHTKALIKGNKFGELIAPKDFDLKILVDSLNSFRDEKMFDYKSSTSWYEYRRQYKAFYDSWISYNESKAPNYKQIQLLFKYDKDGRCEIYIDHERLYFGKSTKPILYTILTVRYQEKYKKGIDLQQLICLSHYYDGGKNFLKKLRDRLDGKNYKNL